MEVFLCQTNPAWEQPAVSIAKVRDLLARKPPSPGSLIVLPEMFSTGFSLDLEKTCGAHVGLAEEFIQ